MKKFFIVAVALVAAVFTSCSKDDLGVESNDVKVNFAVAEKPEFAATTRALKSDWAVGDEILIVFQSADKSWLDCSNGQNSIKLTKTAGGWDVDDTNCPAIEDLSSGKSYFAIHYPGNIKLGNFDSATNMAEFSNYVSGNEYLLCQNTYTISGNEITLGTIAMARTSGSFQISVKNLAEYNENWIMKLHNASGFAIDQCYIGLRMYFMATVQITGKNTVGEASAVTVGTDEVFNFRGGNSSKAAKWISLTKTNGTYYYKLDAEKTMSDLAGKAWILPELKINGSDQIEAGCEWTKTME